jgi:transcriptional regulator with XRE-family HTH domain
MAATSGQLGPNLKLARERSRLTQEELASKAKVNLSTYIRWEHGKATPRWANLESVADALKIDIAELLDDGIDRTDGELTMGEEVTMLRQQVGDLTDKLDAVLAMFTDAEVLAAALDRRRSADDDDASPVDVRGKLPRGGVRVEPKPKPRARGAARK